MDIQLLEEKFIEQSKIAETALAKCNEMKGIYWKDFFEKIITELKEFHGSQNTLFKDICVSKVFVDPMIHGYLEELRISYEINGEYKSLYIGLIFIKDNEVNDFNRYYSEENTNKSKLLLLEKNILLLFKERQKLTELFKLDSTNIYYK